MKCKYCQAEVFIYTGSPNYETEKNMIDRWECRECNCYYATGGYGDIISTSWKVDLDGHWYFIKMYHRSIVAHEEFIISHQIVSGDTKHSLQFSWREVKRFNFIPKDWTPQNSKHKLKIYLPFL